MTPPWWGIPAILVLGIALVAFGWWWDRRRRLRDAAAERRSPDRAIPGQDGEASDPAYTTADDLAAAAAERTRRPEPPDAAALLSRRDEAATLPGGTPDTVFLTLHRRGLAALVDPLVLVTDAAVESERALLPLLERAGATSRTLVVVAPEFSGGALGTLRANVVTGRVAVLPVELADPDEQRRAVALTGGRLVAGEDLLSGYLPEDAWGTCAGWVSDLDESWIITG